MACASQGFDVRDLQLEISSLSSLDILEYRIAKIAILNHTCWHTQDWLMRQCSKCAMVIHMTLRGVSS